MLRPFVPGKLAGPAPDRLPDSLECGRFLHNAAQGAKESKTRRTVLKLSRRNRIVIIDATDRKGFPGFLGCFAERICQVAQQRCWVHKTANSLDEMPKKKSCGRSSG